MYLYNPISQALVAVISSTRTTYTNQIYIDRKLATLTQHGYHGTTDSHSAFVFVVGYDMVVLGS